jgi:hypothetical protein
MFQSLTRMTKNRFINLWLFTFGEKDMHVNTDIIRKYIFATLLNYKIKLFGIQFISEYLNEITVYKTFNLP